MIAAKLYPGQPHIADIGFTVGIMSLMDALFGMPMAEILQKITVNPAIGEALLLRTGKYGDMLKLVEDVERIDDAGALLSPTLHKLQLSAADLCQLQISAFAWSDSITGAAS
ncbi:MAG: hypothetical protein Q8Q81_12105 [Oxalobacteraceae bacterium]|nr:hypothetical protein [Oxalobacteraceae bacterium]